MKQLTLGEVRRRLKESGVAPKNYDATEDVLAAGQVLVVLRGKNGKPYFIGGFKKMSAIGKQMQRLCRSMEKKGG